MQLTAFALHLQVVTIMYSSYIIYSIEINQHVMAKKMYKISEQSCSLKDVLDIIGGKWAMPIIYVLSKGKMRFKELERSIEGINTRMLVKELKNMEANKIITRKVFATVPPTVEYTLTNKGLKLLPSIKSLHDWGKEFTT